MAYSILMFLLLSCMLSITKFVLHSIELPYFVLSVVVVVEVVRVVVLWGEQVYSDEIGRAHV